VPCKWLDKFHHRPECTIPMPCTAFSGLQPQIYPHESTKTHFFILPGFCRGVNGGEP